MENFEDILAVITPANRHNKELMKAILEYTQALVMVEVSKVHLATRKKQRRAGRVWGWPYLQRRVELGHYDNLMEELAAESPELYKNFTRINKELFNEIADRVTPHIQKQLTFWRTPLAPGVRVAITLRFLATGESYKSLQYSFRVADNIISIVPETCRAIVAVFGDEELHLPQAPEEWKEVARGFEERWNFSHVIGSIDGKHIRLRNPALGGTYYFNYKKFYSMILLAIVDSNYKFLMSMSVPLGRSLMVVCLPRHN